MDAPPPSLGEQTQRYTVAERTLTELLAFARKAGEPQKRDRSYMLARS